MKCHANQRKLGSQPEGGLTMRVWSFRFCAAVTILSSSLAAIGAEIKIISSVGMRAVLEELQPQFEGTTQHKLIITFGTAAPLKRQVDEGAAFDVTILTPPMLEDLAKSGKVETDSVVSVAKTGIGLAARKDAAPLEDASHRDRDAPGRFGDRGGRRQGRARLCVGERNRPRAGGEAGWAGAGRPAEL